MGERAVQATKSKSHAWAVTALTRQHPHHGSRAGYVRLVDHLRERVPVDTIDGSNFGWIPSRVCRSMARRSGSRWYSYDSFRMEAEAMLGLFSAGGRIFHVLYAENDLRYLGGAGPLRRRVGGTLAATYHQPPGILREVVDMRRTARGLDVAIALGSNQIPYLASVVGDHRVFLIPHGVETDYFQPPTKRKDPNRRICLFVGGWLRDVEMLEAVIASVEAADPSITFRLVVGKDEVFDSRSAEVLSSLSDADLVREYRSADMLLLPYVDCVASNTLLEGMACGLPIVTTNVGGVGDYVTDECAVAVPAGDVGSMSEAVLELAQDDALRTAMGTSSRRAAMAFDWAHVARRHVELYARLLA